MIFKGIDGQTVEFRINNYQFPHLYYSEDANWLLIHIIVNSKVGNWEAVDPSLTTLDVQEIIEWFIEISNDIKPEWNPLEFPEPCLSFEYIENSTGTKKIRIIFDLELRPKKADDKKEYFVDCEWTNEELKILAGDLLKELEKFPVRPVK